MKNIIVPVQKSISSAIPFLILLLFLACKSTKTLPDSQIIKTSEIHEYLKSNDKIILTKKTITGDLDFTKIDGIKNMISQGVLCNYINKSITFIECTFQGKVSGFSKEKNSDVSFMLLCDFDKNVTFINCSFQDEVNFRDAVFRGGVNFSKSIFYKEALFQGADFSSKNSYFIEATFKNKAHFENLRIGGDIYFNNVVFDGNVSFQKSVFWGNSQFNVCKFNKAARFNDITLYGDFMMNYASFLEPGLELKDATFYKDIDFKDNKLSSQPKLRNISVFGRIRTENSTHINISDSTIFKIIQK